MAKIRYNPIIAENAWFVKSKTKFSGSRQQFYFGYHPKRWDYNDVIQSLCSHIQLQVLYRQNNKIILQIKLFIIQA